MCTVRLFSQAVDLFGLKFYLYTGRLPSTILGTRKLDTGLPDGEDRIPLHSLVLIQYRSAADRQTDRGTDRRTDLP